MELQHFRCFIALAEELNFTRAAERLHLSQPHLTRIINQIEKELGVSLLQRTTRKVQLTNAGEKFLSESISVITKVEQVIQTMQQFANNENRRLSIGFTEMARHSVVPKIISLYRDKYPQIELEILEECTEELVKALQDKKVDIAILHPPLRADFVDLISVYQESFMIALPLAHPHALQNEIAFKDLANDTFILHYRKHGPILYDKIVNLCQQAGFTPKIIHQDTGKSFLGYVTADVGICFVTLSMQNTKNPGVICLPIAGDAPILEHAVAWRKDDNLPLIKEFLEVVQEIIVNGTS